MDSVTIDTTQEYKNTECSASHSVH